MKKCCYKSALVILMILVFSGNVLGWTCKTHAFIALKAGLKNSYSACFSDISREENINLLGQFHWHNAAPSTIVTPQYIDQYQVVEEKFIKLNSPESKPIKIRVPNNSGVLYWKIVELYQKMKGKKGWEYDYYLFNIAHYVGDLSQPLHNFPHGDDPASDGKSYPEIGYWSKEHHGEFDSVLDPFLPLKSADEKVFQSMITSIHITSIDDLENEISKIANISISLANKCYSENKRPMRKAEALRQLALSVSLLKGIIQSTRDLEGGSK